MFGKWKMKIWDDSGKPIDKIEGSLKEIDKGFKEFKKNKLGF